MNLHEYFLNENVISKPFETHELCRKDNGSLMLVRLLYQISTGKHAPVVLCTLILVTITLMNSTKR